MQEQDFMHVTDHYAQLVTQLEPKVLAVYNTTKNARVETGYRNRNFIVYKMGGRHPEVLDRILVNDFHCSDEDGASTELMRMSDGEILNVGYAPQQLWDWPIFVCIPLHAKVRWAAKEEAPADGSLAFPLVIRTVSRLHKRERGVVYFETGPEFGKEFDIAIAE
jgi:hypothetical protein